MNRDEALRCLDLSREALGQGNHERALKFAQKSLRLCETEEVCQVPGMARMLAMHRAPPTRACCGLRNCAVHNLQTAKQHPARFPNPPPTATIPLRLRHPTSPDAGPTPLPPRRQALHRYAVDQRKPLVVPPSFMTRRTKPPLSSGNSSPESAQPSAFTRSCPSARMPVTTISKRRTASSPSSSTLIKTVPTAPTRPLKVVRLLYKHRHTRTHRGFCC